MAGIRALQLSQSEVRRLRRLSVFVINMKACSVYIGTSREKSIRKKESDFTGPSYKANSSALFSTF